MTKQKLFYRQNEHARLPQSVFQPMASSNTLINRALRKFMAILTVAMCLTAFLGPVAHANYVEAGWEAEISTDVAEMEADVDEQKTNIVLTAAHALVAGWRLVLLRPNSDHSFIAAGTSPPRRPPRLL